MKRGFLLAAFAAAALAAVTSWCNGSSAAAKSARDQAFERQMDAQLRARDPEAAQRRMRGRPTARGRHVRHRQVALRVRFDPDACRRGTPRPLDRSGRCGRHLDRRFGERIIGRRSSRARAFQDGAAPVRSSRTWSNISLRWASRPARSPTPARTSLRLPAAWRPSQPSSRRMPKATAASSSIIESAARRCPSRPSRPRTPCS